MKSRTLITLALGLTFLAATPALAQPTLAWSTIDCGGGLVSAGSLTLNGTIGQHDATNALSAGTLTLTGGFWLDLTLPCLPDFNHDGELDLFDYLDFVSFFSTANPSADFNGDTVVDLFDYLDFVDLFSMGC